MWSGTVTYTYDPLERLTSATLAGQSTVTYGWDAVPNRTSVGSATTTYDAANRPTSGTNPTATYTSDDDGRLLSALGNQYTWDRLGRLTSVKAAGGTTLATYTYDPLDRLRLIDLPSGTDTRFRYVGLTTSAAQWLDHGAGTVIRSVGTGWTGERLLDWTGTNSNLRYHGTNAHRDVTWLAGSSGTVSQSLRYDPWGTPRPGSVPSGYSPFRFQGAWHDDTSGLAWVVTRWYAPALGRFLSEDSLLGAPIDPPSRHLYAYGAGEPVGRWDPDGRFWYKVKSGETLGSLAGRYLRSSSDWRWIFNRNRRRIADWDVIKAGWCIWIPNLSKPFRPDQCDWGRRTTAITDSRAIKAASALGVDLRTLTYPRLISLTKRLTGRGYSPTSQHKINRASVSGVLTPIFALNSEKVVGKLAGVTYVNTSFSGLPAPGADATTIGGFVFVNDSSLINDDPLTAHEYIHVLYIESLGLLLGPLYGINLLTFSGSDPRHPYEALGYLWQGYISAYGNDRLGSTYGDNQPWCSFKPIDYSWNYCP